MLLNKEKTIEEIKEVIESIKYYINQDGGDLEYHDFDEKTGEVTIKISGACVGCHMIDLTYQDSVKTILKSEVKEVKSIKVIE